MKASDKDESVPILQYIAVCCAFVLNAFILYIRNIFTSNISHSDNKYMLECEYIA